MLKADSTPSAVALSNRGKPHEIAYGIRWTSITPVVVKPQIMKPTSNSQNVELRVIRRSRAANGVALPPAAAFSVRLAGVIRNHANPAKLARQPIQPISTARSGRIISSPPDAPDVAIPVARPRCSSKIWATVADAWGAASAP